MCISFSAEHIAEVSGADNAIIGNFVECIFGIAGKFLIDTAIAVGTDLSKPQTSLMVAELIKRLSRESRVEPVNTYSGDITIVYNSLEVFFRQRSGTADSHNTAV